MLVFVYEAFLSLSIYVNIWDVVGGSEGTSGTCRQRLLCGTPHPLRLKHRGGENVWVPTHLYFRVFFGTEFLWSNKIWQSLLYCFCFVTVTRFVIMNNDGRLPVLQVCGFLLLTIP